MMTVNQQRVLWLAVWLAAAVLLALGIHPLSPGEPIGGLSALWHGVLAGRDTLSHDYPAAWWGWEQVRRTGNLPLWNPSWFCGEAFIASQTFMPFYPPNWLALALPFPLAFNIQYPLHLLLAAAVMAWACRRRGLLWTAAGLAGLSWGFGSHLATLAGPGHIQKLQALTWLPLVTLGAWRIGRGDARRGFLPLGLGLALQVTAGHLQIVYLTCAVALLEALAGFRSTATLAERGKPGYVPVDFRLALGGLGLLFALALSAVFWIPTAEFARLSNRQGALSWEDATRGSLPPEEKFEFIFPRLLGDSMLFGRGEKVYLGRYGESSTSAPERIVSDYAGAGVLVFAAFALLARRRRRRAAWGYALLAAAALALSMGRYHPAFYGAALKVIPGLAHFRSPSTMMALLAYGLVMAAGLGVEGFLHPPDGDLPKRERAHRTAGSLMLLLAVVAAALLIRAYLVMNNVETAMAQTPKPPDAAAWQARYIGAMAQRATFQGLFLVLALAGTWALLRGMPERLRGRRLAGGLLLAALAGAWGWDQLGNIHPFWNAADVRPYENFLRRHWALARWAREDEPVRYLEPGNELSNRALTLSDFQHFHSVGSASGYHPVAYGKYEALQRRLGFLHPNFLRLFAVKYLLWPMGPNNDWPAGYLEIARDEADRKILLYNADQHYVRAVERIDPVEDFDRMLDRLANPNFNIKDATAVFVKDWPAGLPLKSTGVMPETSLQTRVFAIGPGETRIRATLRKKGQVVVSEPAAPGWRLRFNGELVNQVPIAADGFCLLLALDAGTTDVLLFYDPVSQRLGLFVTLLTLGAGACWIGWRMAGRKLGARASTPATPVPE